MLNDLGWHMKGEVWGDASAALGIINRRGLGKTRHIDTGHLWIQEVPAKDRLKFKKVLGRDNPADLYTKYLDEKTSMHHIRTLAYNFTEGRSEEAPQLHIMSRSKDDYGYGPQEEVCEWVKEVVQCIDNAWDRRQRANNGSREELWIYSGGQRHAHKGNYAIDLRGDKLNAVTGDLGQLVLQGYKRQVQGSNGSNPAQPRRPWGLTRTDPSGHNRVRHPCPDGHARGMGYCSHTLGGFAGRQDPAVSRERSQHIGLCFSSEAPARGALQYPRAHAEKNWKVNGIQKLAGSLRDTEQLGVAMRWTRRLGNGRRARLPTQGNLYNN